MKSLAYVDKPDTIEHLEVNIRNVIGAIYSQMRGKVSIGPLEYASSKPAEEPTCQKSFSNINGIKISFQ